MGENGVGLLLADAFHQLGVHTLQADIAGALVQVLLVHGTLPVLHPADVLIGAVVGGHL